MQDSVREALSIDRLRSPRRQGIFFYNCESENGSASSTPPFLSAPPSPPPEEEDGDYSVSQASVPFRWEESPGKPKDLLHRRGFSFTGCDFEFSTAAFADSRGGATPMLNLNHGLYYSAPASPQQSAPSSPGRQKDREGEVEEEDDAFSWDGERSLWAEMPGTPKLGSLMAESEFEFSSRMSDSDSAASIAMSSADELFFKGQILPLRMPTYPNSSSHWQLTSSDSSGSSNTVTSSSSVESIPASPKSAGLKNAVINGIFRLVKSPEIRDDRSGRKKSAERGYHRHRSASLSPLRFFRRNEQDGASKKTQLLQSTSFDHERSSRSSSGSSLPRRVHSSRSKTLRELLHLSGSRKGKSSLPETQKSSSESGKPVPESSKSGLESSKSGSESSKNGSESIKKDSESRQTGAEGPEARKGVLESKKILSELKKSSEELRKRMENQNGGAGFSDLPPLPKNPAAKINGSAISKGRVSAHAMHYKNQRLNAEEMRRKTFLPYKQGLLGCLGCATMRIAGLSKTLQQQQPLKS